VRSRATWADQRSDTDFLLPPSGRTQAGGLVKVDTAMTRQLLRHVSVFLAVDHLFGQASEETLGFPAPGIFPRPGLKGRF
jgi:hypothetical protein